MTAYTSTRPDSGSENDLHRQSIPFQPEPGKTVNIAAGVASARVQVATTLQSRQVRVFNSGAVTVFIRRGDVTVAAVVATDYPIGAGTIEIISCDPNQYIAAITASSTATIYFTPGEGL